MSDPVVRLQAVYKAFGSGATRRVLLDRVDLELRPGQLTAVVGRSGSGKSTLLHVIGGLEPIDAGQVEVAGLRIDRCSPSQLVDVRDVKNPDGTVANWQIEGPPPSFFRARDINRSDANQLMERLGVAGAAARLPGVLSGGEQQRLAVARALVNRPQVVLADEPTGNLDEASGHEVLHLLRSVADEGRAVLLVTHDAEAALLADRVLTLRDGRLQQ